MARALDFAKPKLDQGLRARVACHGTFCCEAEDSRRCDERTDGEPSRMPAFATRAVLQGRNDLNGFPQPSRSFATLTARSCVLSGDTSNRASVRTWLYCGRAGSGLASSPPRFRTRATSSGHAERSASSTRPQAQARPLVRTRPFSSAGRFALRTLVVCPDMTTETASPRTC